MPCCLNQQAKCTITALLIPKILKFTPKAEKKIHKTKLALCRNKVRSV